MKNKYNGNISAFIAECFRNELENEISINRHFKTPRDVNELYLTIATWRITRMINIVDFGFVTKSSKIISGATIRRVCRSLEADGYLTVATRYTTSNNLVWSPTQKACEEWLTNEKEN